MWKEVKNKNNSCAMNCIIYKWCYCSKVKSKERLIFPDRKWILHEFWSVWTYLKSSKQCSDYLNPCRQRSTAKNIKNLPPCPMFWSWQKFWVQLWRAITLQWNKVWPNKLHIWISLEKTFNLMYNLICFMQVENSTVIPTT